MQTIFSNSEERVVRILERGFQPEDDCKHYYNDELTRSASAIVEENFAMFPYSMDLWRFIMKTDRVEQLLAAKNLISAEVDRINYCRDQIRGRRELVKGVYFDDEE